MDAKLVKHLDEMMTSGSNRDSTVSSLEKSLAELRERLYRRGQECDELEAENAALKRALSGGSK